ncbi:hypothetical protein OG715_01135 [Kitasatospora purpeofusca]|uniref:hypothetical protein n=1 Tax=Kitasatospora purpeofusca TaxID=67352 RepID=UPI002E1052E1|nr:hypothetical protein OG715_01135 [Kitasatospora purpeofusca]
MRTIMELKEERTLKLADHPLCDWLADESIAERDRLAVLPALAPFVLAFRDLNRWVLRYPHPASAFEEAINAHTREDETHAWLYLEDWRALRMDEWLDWSPAEALWWTTAAPQTAAVRGVLPAFARIACCDGGDPVLRFCQAEVIESTGNVFFRHTAPVAARLSLATGSEYRYLGPYHLERESGHVETENAFDGLVLGPDERRRAAELTNRMFDVFEVMFDAFHAFATDHAQTGRPPRPEHPVRPWSGPRWTASQVLEFQYLSPSTDALRHAWLSRLAGEPLPCLAPSDALASVSYALATAV